MPAKHSNTSPIKLIFFGDVVAKLGRQAVADVLPAWKKTYNPDLVIANVENLAHGKGVTERTLKELQQAGVDLFTSGNHVWSKDDPSDPKIIDQFSLALPANVERTPSTQRWQTVEIGEHKLFVLNLLGKEGIEFDGTTNAFLAFDELYDEMGSPKLLFVDFHGEITSEKIVFGWYVDGRASAVIGTHTHVPTADTRILQEGTGYQTDAGMSGARDESIGVKKEIVLDRFLEKEKRAFVWAEDGPVTINAVYLEIDPITGHCITIQQLIENKNSVKTHE